MKKIILTVVLTIFCAINFYAQSSEIYIVFTPVERDITLPKNPTGIIHTIIEMDNGKISHYFGFLNTDFDIAGASFQNFYSEDLNRFYVDEFKPISFLEEIEYLDWDLIAPQLTENEAKELYYKIGKTSHEGHVYFLDRNEFIRDSLHIIEAVLIPRKKI